MKPIDWTQYRRIVVLTGAGISVASGLRTFRGPGGLWTDGAENGMPSTAEEFLARPEAGWRFFGKFREEVRKALPNAAHLALARRESRLEPGQEWTLITQNIDGLHQKAGSQNVLELHGTLSRTRCGRIECELPPFEDANPYPEDAPRCPICQSWLRPDIVFFEERLPVEAEWFAKRALRDCDLFVAIGTSGTVSPAADFVRGAEYAGARTILVNLEPMQPSNPYFHEEYLGRAEEVLPSLLGVE